MIARWLIWLRCWWCVLTAPARPGPRPAAPARETSCTPDRIAERLARLYAPADDYWRQAWLDFGCWLASMTADENRYRREQGLGPAPLPALPERLVAA